MFVGLGFTEEDRLGLTTPTLQTELQHAVMSAGFGVTR